MLDGCSAKLCDGMKESERNTGDLEYLKEFRVVMKLSCALHFPRKMIAPYFELYFYWP